MNALKIAFPLVIASLLSACAATGKRTAATLESADAAAPSLLWSTTADIEGPESVTVDAATKRIFVSNMAGEGAAKDGNGWIALVTPQGTTKVVEGLDAPKGLRVKDGILWAADIDTVVKVDATTFEVLAKIPVPGATFLNDLDVADDGTVYVSDMILSKIYALKGDRPTLFAAGEDLESPNGLLVVGDKLYVTSWGFITDPSTMGTRTPGNLYALDLKTKGKTLVTRAPLGHLDGLERTADGDFLVSDWLAGKVFRVTRDGNATTLLEGLHNSADIGLDGNVLLVPETGTSTVSAFSL